MKSTRRVILFTLLVATLLNACAGPATTATDQPEDAANPEVTEEAGNTAPSDAVLRVGWSSEMDTANPLTTYSTEGVEVQSLIYDKLLGFDLNLQPEPQLAESFEYSNEGRTITFHLRTNAKWHDGEAVTADDVVFTYNLIHDNELGSAAKWLTNLESITADDDHTVSMTFSKPQAFNPALALFILPEHIWSGMTVDEIETFDNNEPVGSGPYKFVSWEQGSTITLERNPDFWGDTPPASQIVFVLYGNEDVMAQALRSGDIDFITEVPPTIFDGLTDVENVKAVSLPSFSFHHIGINVSEDANSLGNPLLLDKTIRQALNYAINRDQLVEVVLAGHGRVGDSIVPIGITDWHLDIPADMEMNANPDRANEILDAAGYEDTDGDGVREDADGNPLEFRLIVIESTSVDVRAAQLFQTSAAEVGIALDVQAMDENTLGDIVYNTDGPDWDLFVWGWDSEVPDPDYMLSVPLCSQIGGDNDVFYCNETYDTMFEEQATTLDTADRKAIVDEMQQIFYDDAAYIVMWYQDKLQAYRTDTWTGWTDVPGGIIYNFTRDNYLNIHPAG